MRGERLAWLVTVPIAVVGCESAHALTNAVFGLSEGGAGELLRTGGPGAGLIPALASLAVAIVVLGLVTRAAGAWPGHRPTPTRLPFALLAPALFVVQELVETVLRTGAPPLGTVLEPTFLPGLLLQIPFAIAGYIVARALIRLADGVRALVAARRRAPHRAAARARLRPASVAPIPSEAHRWAHSGRAPPAPAAATA